jgi:hypothetical protein
MAPVPRPIAADPSLIPAILGATVAVSVALFAGGLNWLIRPAAPAVIATRPVPSARPVARTPPTSQTAELPGDAGEAPIVR